MREMPLSESSWVSRPLLPTGCSCVALKNTVKPRKLNQVTWRLFVPTTSNRLWSALLALEEPITRQNKYQRTTKYHNEKLDKQKTKAYFSEKQNKKHQCRGDCPASLDHFGLTPRRTLTLLPLHFYPSFPGCTRVPWSDHNSQFRHILPQSCHLFSEILTSKLFSLLAT